MNDLPYEPADDSSERAQDEAFEARLRQLTPMQACGETTTGDSLTAETLLYQAGYQAACSRFDLGGSGTTELRPLSPPSRRSRRYAGWLPIIAASLFTAVLTLPIAYRAGNHARIDSPERPVAEPNARPVGVAEIDADPDDKPVSESTSTIASSVLSIQLFSPADILTPAWKRDHAHTTTLTAYTAPESIERSNWIALEKESFARRRTLAAGDVHDASFDLHF